MREFKFRGKDTNGSWMHGHLGDGIWDGGITQLIANGYIDENTIGQYIDKNDINNKEIYEGDICDITFRLRDNKDIQYSDVFLIKWNSQSSSFILTNKILNSNISISYVEFSYIKILGNIYDNPELLKEEINENY